MPPRKPVLALVLLVAVIGVVAAAPAIAQDEYEIEFLDETVDIPDRTITFDGNDYPVSSIGVRKPDEPFTVEVSTPDDDDDFLVQVRDTNRNTQDFRTADQLTDDGRATFDPTDFDADPGIYVVVIYTDGNVEAIYPVLLEAYDVTADVPDEVETGSDIPISAELEARSEEELSGVQAVFVGQDESFAVDLDGSGDAYEDEIATEDFSPGSYAVYVAAIGTETFEDTELPIGISARHDLEVVEPSGTETPTESPADGNGDDGGNGDADGGGYGGGSTDTATQTSSPNETATETQTTTETTTSNRTSTTTSVSTTTTTPESPTETSTTGATTISATDDNVVTPNTVTTTEDDDEGAAGTGGQPGFTVPVALLALVLLGLRRWRTA